MTISIDLDNTWSVDPTLWNAFRQVAETRGHRVVMVTNRHSINQEDRDRFSIPPGMPVIEAGAQLKGKAAKAHGFKVDVWIDDMPGTVELCHMIGESPDKDL